MTTHDQLWVDGGGDQRLRNKKPQSALADWGKVIGPYLQAAALGVASAHGCQISSNVQLE